MTTLNSLMSYGRGRSRASVYVYGAIGGVLLTLASRSIGAADTAIAFSIGAFAWTLVEYLLHRFSFHAPLRWAPGRPLHLDHHTHALSPDHIGAPVALSLPLYAVLITAFTEVTGSLSLGMALSAGLATAYVGYERLHYWTHHGKARSRLGLYLKRYHMAHHFKDSRRSFGVTSPIWDWVFGTLPARSSRQLPER